MSKQLSPVKDISMNQKEREQWLDGIIDTLKETKKNVAIPSLVKTTKTIQPQSPVRRSRSIMTSSQKAKIAAARQQHLQEQKAATAAAVAAKKKKKEMEQNDIMALCEQAAEIFLKQPMLLELAAPIKICGDVHGQFHDLLRIFDDGGSPPDVSTTCAVNYINVKE